MNKDQATYLDKMIANSARYFMYTRYQIIKSTSDAISLAKSDMQGLTNYLRGIGAIKGATYSIDGEQVMRIYLDADDFTPMSWDCAYKLVAGVVVPTASRTI